MPFLFDKFLGNFSKITCRYLTKFFEIFVSGFYSFIRCQLVFNWFSALRNSSQNLGVYFEMAGKLEFQNNDFRRNRKANVIAKLFTHIAIWRILRQLSLESKFVSNFDTRCFHDFFVLTFDFVSTRACYILARNFKLSQFIFYGKRKSITFHVILLWLCNRNIKAICKLDFVWTWF